MRTSNALRATLAVLAALPVAAVSSVASATPSWHTAASGGPATVISVAADTTSGSFYAVAANNSIHKYAGSWSSISGASAYNVFVDHDDVPWIFNLGLQIEYYSGGSWTTVTVSGSPATWIWLGVGRPAANPYDSWALGQSIGGENSLYNIKNIEGTAATTVVANPSAKQPLQVAMGAGTYSCESGTMHGVWVLDSNNDTYQGVPTSSSSCTTLTWTKESGTHASVAITSSFMLGTAANPDVWHWSSGWSSVGHPTGVSLTLVGAANDGVSVAASDGSTVYMYY